jgi:hypothetical protein
MAISVLHKNVFAGSTDASTGYAAAVMKGLYTALNANPDKFTILEVSGGADSAGDWFVFKQVGGTWEMFVGAIYTDNNTYSSAHRGGIPLATDYTVCVALAPAGGWEVGVDDPNGATMFSNSPLDGTWWTKIQSSVPYTSGGDASSGGNNWLTIITDPAVGYFYALFDYTQNNSWNQVLAVLPYSSTNPADEATYPPFLWVSGIPAMGYWFEDNVASACGALLLPGDATACNVITRLLTLDATNQPNPRSGKYDVYRLPIRTSTASVIHQAGYILGSAVRQIDSSRAARSRFNEGTWITPAASAGCVIPWDGSAF